MGNHLLKRGVASRAFTLIKTSSIIHSRLYISGSLA